MIKCENMRYNDVLNSLQNLTNTRPTQQEIANIIGIGQNAVSGRAKRNSEFSEDEIILLQNHFNVIFENDTELIEIEHIHINPSCGHGTIVIDEPDITPVKLGKKMIQTILKVSDPNNLKTFTASGDSMEDTIDDGNILLVDIGRTDYTNGGIFVITINNDWYVKRIRKRLSGELDIISDNQSKYPIETYKPDDNIEIVIKGRVIKNLSKGL